MIGCQVIARQNFSAGHKLSGGMRHLREVDRLKTVSVRLKRRISLREKGPKDADVILGAHFVGKLGEADLHLPADVFPIWAGRSELQRLRAFPTIGLSNPDSENAGVPE